MSTFRRLASIALPVALLLIAAQAADAGQDTDKPRNQLLGDWRFAGGASYHFTRRDGRVSGRSRRTLRLGGCRIRRGTLVFRSYRFQERRGNKDVWRGRVAFVQDDCKRIFVRSTIVVESDLVFTETSRLDGRVQRPTTFKRIRPQVGPSDPVVGTWVRNSVGIVVTAARTDYEGRARESFSIGNGCVIPAGTLIWRIDPLAPGIYDGAVETFLSPQQKCRPGSPAVSRWRLPSDKELVRESVGQARSFLYTRG